MALKTNDWTKETVPFSLLKEKADEWDWGVFLSGSEETATMVEFLKFSGIIPSIVVWNRKNSLPRTSLDKNAIPAGYLAEVAHEWDSDGFSEAKDFVAAIEFEIAGTVKNHMVSEVMEELGR